MEGLLPRTRHQDTDHYQLYPVAGLLIAWTFAVDFCPTNLFDRPVLTYRTVNSVTMPRSK